MAKEWNGLQMLFAGQYTSAVLMGKGNPIRVPADMNGVKVGATGMAQDVVTACGGVPVFMIPPDMYQDLQTGVVSDALVAWGAAMDWQLQEQTKWVLDITFGGGEMSGVMNAQTWNKISPQDQQILTQVGSETEQVDFNFIAKPGTGSPPEMGSCGHTDNNTDRSRDAAMDRQISGTVE